MKKMTIMAAVILVMGCKAGIETKGSASENGMQTNTRKSNVEYKVLAKNDYSNSDVKTFEVIRSENELSKFAALPGLDEVPKVDFKNKMIVILFAGQKSSGGHNIDVDYMELTRETLYIKSRQTSPSGMATMAMTNPYCMLEVPRAENVNVEF